MSKEGSQKDIWDKLDVIAKFAGGVIIVIIGLLINTRLQKDAEENRNNQLYANIVSEREKADGEIRAEMFKSLMDRYFKEVKEGNETEEDLHKRIMFLDLLVNNFQEYFNARPLFESLYEDLAKRDNFPEREALQNYLIETVRRIASKEAILLAKEGIQWDDVIVAEKRTTKRIPLYDTTGLEGLSEAEFCKPNSLSEGKYKDDRARREGERYSIRITVNQLREHSVDISIALYRDYFDNDIYNPSRSFIKNVAINASYFDTPYLDNTRLFDGSRFCILYKGSLSKEEVKKVKNDHGCVDDMIGVPLDKHDTGPLILFNLVMFREEFLSQRDRPYVEEMIKKIRNGR